MILYRDKIYFSGPPDAVALPQVENTAQLLIAADSRRQVRFSAPGMTSPSSVTSNPGRERSPATSRGQRSPAGGGGAAAASLPAAAGLRRPSGRTAPALLDGSPPMKSGGHGGDLGARRPCLKQPL